MLLNLLTLLIDILFYSIYVQLKTDGLDHFELLST